MWTNTDSVSYLIETSCWTIFAFLISVILSLIFQTFLSEFNIFTCINTEENVIVHEYPISRFAKRLVKYLLCMQNPSYRKTLFDVNSNIKINSEIFCL